jgi:hypothetical protein
MTTLTQLKKLEKYIKVYGDDQLITSSLLKIMDYKIQQYEKLLDELRSDLIKMEKKYDKKSDDFYPSFKKGELGDDMDYVEWGSLYDMYQRILSKKKMLESVIEEPL